VEVSKAYGKRLTALKNLTLNVGEGTSFGLLAERWMAKRDLVLH
jgi:ABC-type multidrug transport system ATPase subunit